MKKVSITGKVLTGGLAGTNYGTIVESEVSEGTVKALGSNDNNSGGMVAANYGLIKNSFTNVKMIGANDFMGGLVGHNFGTIKDSHTAGETIGAGSDPDGVGGLVGNNEGKILHSYATGDVNAIYGADGGEYTGGLVGYEEKVVL